MFFEKERDIRKQLLDNSKNVANYVDENEDPQRLAVLTMIKIQQELASKRRKRSVVNRELATK
ncbi:MULTISPECIES: hypothetical protein [Acinetobacter]|uniref:Uncharacterized protein n=1 Tax=Acinetobacter oleivorans TaxID=1148157 RepID=A0ABR9NH84_9GAMM|nr:MULTISPECIES: hypothetical protein [Acinetobacter]MBE2163825.1 hypothetical protein [Acinetobacter oleivorans]